MTVQRFTRRPRSRKNTVDLIVDPVESARIAGLRYVTDSTPGISRIRSGKHFSYRDTNGKVIRDAAELQRIRALVIPPAWTNVWICPNPKGHLQATGRDARGRKQYRYHPKWREVRDGTKYDKLIGFGETLPAIREATARDLAKPGLPREKVLATIVQLLEKTLIRIGNEEYARENNSFGLTTMREHHVDVSGSKLRFEFRGKGGIKHAVDVNDRRLARIVEKCQELPGQELFQYVDDDGNRQTVDSADVNEYLREIAAQDFTAKDFRTWAGTVLAAHALQELHGFASNNDAKKRIVRAVESVAMKLGNTKAVCRKCYIHPAVLDSYLDGSLVETLAQRADQEAAKGLSGLPPEEAAVLMLLRTRLQDAADQRRATRKRRAA